MDVFNTYLLSYLGILYGLIYLTFLILRRWRFSKMIWVMQLEFAIFVTAVSILYCLSQSGSDVNIAYGLAGWVFLFAVVATFAVFLTSKAKKMQ